MSRQARIVVPQYLYHVTQRGNYRQNIFDEALDRVYYLKLIQEYSQTYEAQIYAFCLMDNHVHFIVKPLRENSLAEVFCRAHQRYSLYFHKKKKTAGHLWQERFYSCLLEGNHIPNAIRYVERNPVRAGKVVNPWEYTWSSAKAHMGVKYQIIQLYDIKEFIAGVCWQTFLSQPEDEKFVKLLRENTKKSFVLGSDEFLAQIGQKLKCTLIRKPRGRPSSKIVTGTIY